MVLIPTNTRLLNCVPMNSYFLLIKNVIYESDSVFNFCTIHKFLWCGVVGVGVKCQNHNSASEEEKTNFTYTIIN